MITLLLLVRAAYYGYYSSCTSCSW